MREPEVRSALIAYLRNTYGGLTDALAVDELNVCHGQSRVDLALITDESLHGFEIKSRVDKLTRLEGQLADYRAVFDRVTVVIGVNHLTGVLAEIPTWCGVLLASREGGEVVVERFRESQRNPHQNAYSLAQLLWRDEGLEVLRQWNFERGVKSKAKRFIWERLAERLSLDDLSREVRDVLRTRPGDWRAGRKVWL